MYARSLIRSSQTQAHQRSGVLRAVDVNGRTRLAVPADAPHRGREGAARRPSTILRSRVRFQDGACQSSIANVNIVPTQGRGFRTTWRDRVTALSTRAVISAWFFLPRCFVGHLRDQSGDLFAILDPYLVSISMPLVPLQVYSLSASIYTILMSTVHIVRVYSYILGSNI